jgi:hypothetical protein
MIKNWKTTLSGLLIFIILGLYLLNKITNEQFLTTTTFLIGIGFISAKDGNKTNV